MSEEPKFQVNPESDKSVSEQLAEENKKLGEQAVNLAGWEKELSERTLPQRANPINWGEKKWWKQAKEGHAQDEETLRQQVAEYIGEVQEEANNYVAAYQEYEQAQAALSSSTGGETAQQNMGAFIDDMDMLGDRFFRYEAKEIDKSDVEARTELFRKQARLLAVKDFFTPHLPLDPKDKQRGFTISYVDFGHRYRTGWSGERLPRLDLGGNDKGEALEKAKSSGDPNLLEIRFSASMYFDNPSQTRYVALSEEASKLVAEFPGALDGGVALYEPGGISFRTRPSATIDFESKLLSLSKVEKSITEPQTKITLEYELETPSGVHPKSLQLSGSLEELRGQAAQKIISEEMSPNAGMNLVHAAFVIMPDGTKVRWQDFIQPPQEETERAEETESATVTIPPAESTN